MLTLEKLRGFCPDIDEGLERCMNNESFYLKLVGMSLEDKNFAALGKALDECDLVTAFGAAHSLKGVFGNLSLTPIFRPLSELTELLRAKAHGDYSALYKEIIAQRDKLIALSEQ